MRKYAPVALFAYNRPSHLAQTLDALRANPEAYLTDLYVFSDGAKNESTEPAVAEVRKVLADVQGFKSVTVIAREQNFGLGKSIIDGVSIICEKHGYVIVLEDDLVTSPYFLRYMNDGLDYYAEDSRVASILGYALPLSIKTPITYFVRGADCLGWATWSRAWNLFEPDGSRLLDELLRTGHSERLDLHGALRFTQMLRDQIAGKNSSWAVRWHVSMFLLGMLTLTPHQSLICHIGNDGSGTNFGNESFLDTPMCTMEISVGNIVVEEHMDAHLATVRYYRNYASLWARLLRRVRRLVH